MRWRPFAILLLFLGPITAPGAVAALDVSDLPTPVETWRWEGSSQSLLAAGELLFVAGKGRVSALDPASGDLLWSTAIGTEEEDCGCGHGSHVLVDDRLFVPIADSVAVLDADDGTLVGRTPLGGGSVFRVEGPPVMARARAGGRTILARFDELVGVEVAKLEIEHEHGIEQIGDRVIVTVRRDPGSSASAAETAGGSVEDRVATVLLGLDEHLQMVWTRELEGWGHLDREGDRLIATSYPRDEAERRPVDPETGELGPLLPDPEEKAERAATLSCHEEEAVDSFELEVSAAGDRASSDHTIRRRGPRPWRLEVPGYPRECDVWGDRLLLRLDRGAVRDLLAVVRARSGEPENLLLLPVESKAVLIAGGEPVLETRDGLVGIDPVDRGPALREVRSLREAVTETLALAEGSTISDVATELSDLGPEALPVVTEALPHLGGDALLAAATLVADARYVAAAAPLAEAIENLDRAGSGSATTPGEGLVLALAGIAGPDQVTTLARYASPEAPQACLPALAALGRIGSPEARGAVDRALARNLDRAGLDSSGPWFRPPSPPRLGPVRPAEASALVERLEESGTADDLGWEDVLAIVRSTEVRSPEGTLLVFPVGRLLSYDELWIAEDAAEGEPPSVFFLGVLGSCGTFEVEIVDGVLSVQCGRASLEEVMAEITGEGPYHAEEEELQPRAAMRPLRVPLGAWRVDRDGDGLTDLLEAYVGLGPSSADTDGDGLADSDDPAPNAGASAALDPDAGMLHAALATVWACILEHEAVLVVRGAPALEWRRPDGVTLPEVPIATPVETRAFSSLRVAVDGEALDLGDPPENLELPAAGERLVTLLLGPEEYGARVDLVLRFRDDRWLVTRSEGTPNPYYYHH